jgi:soluble lytic murein transglycosylase
LRTVRRLVDDFSNQSWAEEALNNLATDYIQQDDDDKADETFREMWEKFPSGRYAERAAWKIGWRAYKNHDYARTARTFESGAARFPRSDYRPAWVYWSGRAHEALNETALAEARYTLAATDYLNSYYGRLAVKRLNDRAPQRRLIADVQAAATDGAPSTSPPDDAPPMAPLPPSEQLVRALLGLGLYDQALDELRYAQKVWGDSSAIEATLAWTYLKQGQAETGARRFTLYRSAINTMKRAYPQFLAAGGEGLPKDLLRVIFPVAYWDLIRKYAAERNLDPYFVAALVAQESTFVSDIKSSANAVGLMQLMATTARQYARRLGMKYSPTLLTNAETNIRIGTAYLADKIREFGDLHLVLASYNAGEHRVSRWLAERPGVERDEFIDDIPFPETQNYVKKILGTAEDYRRLYGSESTVAELETGGVTRTTAEPVSPAASKQPKAKAPTPKKKKAATARRKTRKSA